MEQCPECGNEYELIANHWNQSQCKHPSFTGQQKEIVTGMLMGDGCINRGNKNPSLEAQMVSPNYLTFIDEKFGMFGKGVSLMNTAAESAKRVRDSGMNQEAVEKNYSDIYRWRSMGHPELTEFAEWYASGKKVWPKDIELTPTTLKHFYVGDGSWNNTDGHNHISIAMLNEVDNTSKVNKMFERVGLPSPSNYNISERSCIAQFTVEQSKELWKYMGEPLPDFEYKWPDRYC